MLTEKLEKYRRLYSEYISHAVDLHNYHLSFLNNLGFRTAKDVRRSLRSMIKLEREMHRVTWEVRQESKINKRRIREEERAKRAEEKAYKKAHPKKRGPKGKNNGNSNPT